MTARRTTRTTIPRKKILAKMSTNVMFLALTRATIPEPIIARAAPRVAGVALDFGDSEVKIIPWCARGMFSRALFILGKNYHINLLASINYSNLVP
jgi:hypothetical protein